MVYKLNISLLRTPPIRPFYFPPHLQEQVILDNI